MPIHLSLRTGAAKEEVLVARRGLLALKIARILTSHKILLQNTFRISELKPIPVGNLSHSMNLYPGFPRFLRFKRWFDGNLLLDLSTGQNHASFLNADGLMANETSTLPEHR
jgi:hypothetical protein